MTCPPRSICVVTGTRAEYGLLYWLMKHIDDDDELTLQVIATGAHLSPEFGLTYRDIENDGFGIDEKVEMLLSSDTPSAIGTSMGLATIGFSGALERLRPDLVVILGDRYEILAAALAAAIARLPIAHLHGGELSEGAIDESLRHCITKLAHLHFVAAEPYRQRVIQLGESPDRVFNVGAPGLDHIERTPRLARDDFQRAVGLDLGDTNFLVTYHPATLSSTDPADSFQQLLNALDQFESAKILFTYAGADARGRQINQLIDQYTDAHPGRAVAHASLGTQRYLSALEHMDAVVGNSSSGILEAPVLKIPTVNIGDRQRGRLRASSIIDCDESAQAIFKAIEHALSPMFQKTLPSTRSVYGHGDASTRILDTLKDTNVDDLAVKHFHDLPPNATP